MPMVTLSWNRMLSAPRMWGRGGGCDLRQEERRGLVAEPDAEADAADDEHGNSDASEACHHCEELSAAVMVAKLYYLPVYLFQSMVRNNVISGCNSLFLTTE
jgi:hypothetical protein